MESPFLLLSVREGHEELMKAEVAMRFLGAKFAFSRPGFLSFKAGKAIETSGGGSSWTYDSAKDLIFPLRSALFVGKFTFDPANDGVKTTRVAGMEALPKCVHLHALDLTGDGQGPMPAPPADWSKAFPGFEAAFAEFRGAAGGASRLNEEAAIGEGILQIFRVSEREFWVGVSILRASEFGWPGGESRIALPDAAPSRAYLKFEEAARLLERVRGGKPIFRTEERAIEIGCAPGGAVYALLERGLRVTGVDRGEMAPSVARNPRFSQIVSNVGGWELPGNFFAEWLLIDMNAEPAIALRESRAVIERVAPGLKGVFLTLKLNRLEYLASAERLARTTAKELGLKTWFLKQLPSHHQEFGFFGMR